MQSQPDFDCPACGSSRLSKCTNRNGTYECQNCQTRTHEKIEANREALEYLAASDNPINEIASTLAYPERKDRR